jgi:hypothetical protein
MKPFMDTVNNLRHGKTAVELTEAMAALVKACYDTGKAGELTLRLRVAPGRSGQVEISDLVSTKLPTFERGTSLFFVTDDNNLSRNDPRQENLPGIRSVDTERAA